jgi:phosphopantetheinyl transferase
MVNIESNLPPHAHLAGRGSDNCEQQRVNIYLHRADSDGGSKNSQTSHGLASMAVGRATGTNPDVWRVRHEDSGRPVIQSFVEDMIGPAISLSDTGGYTVVAVSDFPAVGIDIEIVRPRQYAKIAEYLHWRSFAPNFPAEPEANEFFHFWTLWEAGMKASPAANLLRPSDPFRALADRVTAGMPAEVENSGWYSRSWVLPDELWMTLIARSESNNAARFCR